MGRPTLNAALIGHPVAHSLSPVLHRAAGVACGVAVTYDLVDVPPGDVAPAVERLRAAGLRGINITAPHKAEVRACAHRLTPAAAAVGVCNTLTFDPDGIEGHNTDVEGFRRALGPLPGPRVLLLGAGGAARAVAVALVDAGATRVDVLNRTVAKAEALCAELALPALRPGPLSEAAALMGEADVLVNSLPTAAAGWLTALPFAALPRHAPVVTLDYGGRSRPLAEAVAAAATGSTRPFVDGLAMLAWQGVAAFARWTGRQPPIGPVLDALRVAAAASD